MGGAEAEAARPLRYRPRQARRELLSGGGSGPGHGAVGRGRRGLGLPLGSRLGLLAGLGVLGCLRGHRRRGLATAAAGEEAVRPRGASRHLLCGGPLRPGAALCGEPALQREPPR